MATNPKPLLKGYMTLAEFAESIGRNRRTIERWRRLKEAPVITFIGRTPYITDADADAWLASRKREEA